MIFLQRYKKYAATRTPNDNCQINGYFTKYLNVCGNLGEDMRNYYLSIEYKLYCGMKCKKFELYINKCDDYIEIQFTGNKIRISDECDSLTFRRYVGKYVGKYIKNITVSCGDVDDYAHLYDFTQYEKYENLSDRNKKRYLLMINHNLRSVLKL